MGIDIKLFVKGTVTDEEFERGRDEWDFRIYNARLIRGADAWNLNQVTTDQYFTRYWGPGYERGPWPEIASWIEALRAAFPDHEICYGGDNDNDENIPPVTDDMMREYWAHWRSPHAHDYRNYLNS